MSNPETVPSWPSGHRVTGSETKEVTDLLSASGTDGGLWATQMFYRAADQLYSAQTTLQNDTFFVVPCVANATYIFDGCFTYVSNGTALFKCTWSAPSGGGGVWVTNGLPTSVTTAGAVTIDTSNHGINAAAIAMGSQGSANNSICPRGTFITSSTAGNFTFQHAQNVSNGSGGNTTGMKTQSWLRVTRVL